MMNVPLDILDRIVGAHPESVTPWEICRLGLISKTFLHVSRYGKGVELLWRRLLVHVWGSDAQCEMDYQRKTFREVFHIRYMMVIAPVVAVDKLMVSWMKEDIGDVFHELQLLTRKFESMRMNACILNTLALDVGMAWWSSFEGIPTVDRRTVCMLLSDATHDVQAAIHDLHHDVIHDPTNDDMIHKLMQCPVILPRLVQLLGVVNVPHTIEQLVLILVNISISTPSYVNTMVQAGVVGYIVDMLRPHGHLPTHVINQVMLLINIAFDDSRFAELMLMHEVVPLLYMHLVIGSSMNTDEEYILEICGCIHSIVRQAKLIPRHLVRCLQVANVGMSANDTLTVESGLVVYNTVICNNDVITNSVVRQALRTSVDCILNEVDDDVFTRIERSREEFLL
jgi:hypothetical protein